MKIRGKRIPGRGNSPVVETLVFISDLFLLGTQEYTLPHCLAGGWAYGQVLENRL